MVFLAYRLGACGSTAPGSREPSRKASRPSASIPCADHESLAGGSRVRGRRHFMPASRSLPRAGCLCLRFAPFGLPSLLRGKAALPRKPFSQRIRGVTVAGSGGIDPSRKSRSYPSPGRNEKPDLYAVASCTKGRSYVALPRYRTAAKDISDPLDRFALRSGCGDPQAGISQSRIRLLLFL